jgi:hypothetical protein
MGTLLTGNGIPAGFSVMVPPEKAGAGAGGVVPHDLRGRNYA